MFNSNIVARSWPNTALSGASATISRLFSGFCRECLRMCFHTFETTSVRGRGALPTIAASAGEGVTGLARAPAVRLSGAAFAFAEALSLGAALAAVAVFAMFASPFRGDGAGASGPVS